jgi:hypothetical protein
MRGLVRITCQKCGRDITSRTTQADATWMHMRSCKGRAQPTTAADAAGSPWGWKLRAEKALADNAALAQQVEELKKGIFKGESVMMSIPAFATFMEQINEGNEPLLCGHPAKMLYIRSGGPIQIPGPNANCSLCDKLTAERKLQGTREALRAAQWTVHCGQFHQWKTLEQCTEKNCKAVMALIS